MVRLSDLLNASREEIRKIITKTLRNYDLLTTDSYIFGIPKLNSVPLCLVAHYDTVDDYSLKERKIIKDGEILKTDGRGILGADDRAGVYSILYLVSSMTELPYVLFTDYEESGGIGAEDFSKDYLNNYRKMTDINLFIELDRQGFNELVYYNPIPTEVLEYGLSFGFHKSYGSFSDIRIITNITKVPSFNLSIGYYNEHTNDEILFLPAMFHTIGKVADMVRKPIPKRYELPNTKRDEPVFNSREYFLKDIEQLIENGDIDPITFTCRYCGEFYEDCVCGALEEYQI